MSLWPGGALFAYRSPGVRSAVARELGRSRMSSESLELARRYAAKDWSVLPLVSGDKRPAIAGGFHSASAEAEFVEREFFSGSRGVGIRTGGGLVVLDIDPRNG